MILDLSSFLEYFLSECNGGLFFFIFIPEGIINVASIVDIFIAILLSHSSLLIIFKGKKSQSLSFNLAKLKI